jgi:ABC-type lipoprotein release transport system permease subunit
MAAVWMRFRAELRAQWKRIVGVALLAGIAGAAVITAVAGARRTDPTLGRALGSAIHLLVTGVRSRRRDIALLKTVGFTRGQARVGVLVPATVLVALALVVALPMGLLAGRWLWTLTANWLGILNDAPVPALALALVALGAVVVANLVAIGSASLAARIRPAVALRSE